MLFRKATADDLERLRTMYKAVTLAMTESGLTIWNDDYPAGVLIDDIEQERLYLTEADGEITAAFALCESCGGASAVDWENNRASALYLFRFAVNAGLQRSGVGTVALEKAKETARAAGAEYLRLFAAEKNAAAIAFYLHTGFVKAIGSYTEDMGDYSLCEYGYEIKL